MASADVVVVGAGPAGSAAAITLARAGRRVALVDKSSFPRDKCCGDGLTTLALRELEALGLPPATVESWFEVHDVRLRSPSGREIALTLPGDGVYGAVAPRRELDTALVELARSAGAQLHQGRAVSAVRETNTGIQVDVDGLGTLTCAAVIAADGAWSPTRQLLGLNAERDLGEWYGLRQYARVTGRAARELLVWFEPDLLPGYAWSFPLPGGRANLGFGLLRNSKRWSREMPARWNDLLHREHIAAALGEGFELEGRPTTWPIPAAIDRATLAHGRVLFAGDAAKATDLLTGEGIGQALLTGRLAAAALHDHGLDPGRAGAAYTRAVHRELVADHRMSALLGRILATRLGARAALRLVDTSAWARTNFARWMFEDEARAIAFTPRRWHRRFLRRPGAYAAGSAGTPGQPPR